MSTLFPTFQIENEDTSEVTWLHAPSYLYAGVFASLYVLWRTDSRWFLRAFYVNVAFILIALITVFLAAIFPNPLAITLATLIPLILACVQSRIMVRYLCRYYARKGWTITKY